MRKQTPGRKRFAEQQEAAERPRLCRDLEGYVWTGRGFISGPNYDKLRNDNPQQHFPKREDLPLLNE
ncbi:MAG TPA: hypothetical protein VFB14_14020 [Bryobacteraceae bacterium]|jgi:hypothetical protein|nr:hypothetical protein [Bryobacteraceae bacterium]